MSSEHYKNIKKANLFDCLSIRRTRTIPPQLTYLPCGVSEIPLQFHLKNRTIKKLSFNVPWDGVLYGYVHPKSAIKEKLGIESEITSVTIADWDDSYALIFETVGDSEDKAFYVSGDDVITLLENCRRPPEQR